MDRGPSGGERTGDCTEDGRDRDGIAVRGCDGETRTKW